MRCDHELAAAENFRQSLDDIALPLRMQVQLDLIDQNQCHAVGDGVVAARVGDGQASGEVEHQRQQAALSVGKLVQVEGLAALGQRSLGAAQEVGHGPNEVGKLLEASAHRCVQTGVVSALNPRLVGDGK